MANGQLWEIDSQGNKKQISGMVTGELPKYTMAEYTALTNKPIDWICTDYDATSEYGINDTEVKHGNTTVNSAINDNEILSKDVTETTTQYGTINISVNPTQYDIVNVCAFSNDASLSATVSASNGGNSYVYIRNETTGALVANTSVTVRVLYKKKV